MKHQLFTRRQAIARTALAGLSFPLLGTVLSTAADEASRPASELPAHPRLNLGIASYSLNRLPAEAAIAALQLMQVTSASVYSAHVPILISTPDVCREAAQRFRNAGITLTSTGVVTLAKSESVMRRAFECGRAAGLSTMTASYEEHPDRDTLLLTERFVREYDIKLAFHNHGPTDKAFPSPYDVWTAVEPFDPRLGLCIDVGHTAQAGVDPVEAILKCSSRLYDVHMKDTLGGVGGKGVGGKVMKPAGLGFGQLDIRSMMAALIRVGYRFQVGLEYETEAEDPIPGVAQSFGYMRGILAALP